jgi:hypothetical protein
MHHPRLEPQGEIHFQVFVGPERPLKTFSNPAGTVVALHPPKLKVRLANSGAECSAMKLRIRGNSIRVRMDRKDLAELLEWGRATDAIRFGPGADGTLTYAVEVGPAPRQRPHAAYTAGHLRLTIDPDDAEAWSREERVGFYHDQAVEGGVVRVILEKDFACLEQRSVPEPEDAWAFPTRRRASAKPANGVCFRSLPRKGEGEEPCSFA